MSKPISFEAKISNTKLTPYIETMNDLETYEDIEEDPIEELGDYDYFRYNKGE